MISKRSKRSAVTGAAGWGSSSCSVMLSNLDARNNSPLLTLHYIKMDPRTRTLAVTTQTLARRGKRTPCSAR